MRERLEKFRQKYKALSYDDLKKTADEICREIHNGKGYIEVYGTDLVDHDDLVDDAVHMQELIALRDLTQKVIEEKEILNKPKLTTQSELPVEHDNSTNIMDLWREKWDLRIIHQDIARDLYCLSFLSQHFRHITLYKGTDEDLRVHVCLIMPSGTGKSDGNDIFAKMCELTGLRTHFVDRYTDAILTGSVDQKKIERNIKLKLNPGDLGYQDPHQKSILEMYDIIFFDEGENILKTTPATEGAQRILQKAMNRIGSAANMVTNSLVGNSVECYPASNIIITSYFLKEFSKTLLERGLLQRMIVYISPENEKNRIDIINTIIDSVPIFEDDISEAQEKKDELEKLNANIDARFIAELECLKEFHKDTTSIFVHKDANILTKQIVFQLRDILPMQSEQHDIWDSMISRLSVNILKMSALFAIMNYRKHITVYDVRQAAAILMKTMESVGIFLKYNVDETDNKFAKTCYNSLKRCPYIGMPTDEESIVEYLTVKMNLTKPKAREVVESLISMNKIIVTMVDGKRKMKIIGGK